jgi:putative ABC transport system permease protein
MLFKIAWRNIWRSRVRSLVVIGAVMIGIWAVVFMMSFSTGMIESYIDNAIENDISHLQMHHPDFNLDNESKFFFEDAQKISADLNARPEVEAATVRTLVTGMLSNSKGQRGVQLRGINPVEEAATTKLDQRIVEGAYLATDQSNRIMVGRKLADALKLKIRSKVVLAFQSLEGEITYSAFRVAGIFETENSGFDKGTAFVLQTDLNEALGRENIAHEAAALLQSTDPLEVVQADLVSTYPDLLVENYEEISPEIGLFNSQMQVSAFIFIFIIMLALIFGIINTMLMAVLERYKELGVLMAVGMNKARVFGMIVLETLLLGLIALPLGLLLGWGTVNFLADRGIDLSSYSEGMREFGMSEIVYPSVDPSLYGMLAAAVFVTALLASLYPAYKAIRLKPMEAIGKI